MNKKITILFLLLTFAVNAQNATKAKELLNKVSAKVKTYKNIQLDFKYNLQNTKEKINQDSKGTVVLQDNKYCVDFMGVTKICDGKKTYTISKEDQEITIATLANTDDATDTPIKMLTFFNKGFNYSWDIVQKVKGKKIQYIKLTPINTKDDRKQILVGVDLANNQIYNTITVAKNNSRVTLTVNSFKINQALPKNQFTFVQNKYPNYYINKLD